MITPTLDPAGIATLGLQRAENRVAADAQGIAGAGTGAVAQPLTGGQPGNAAGQVFQALQGGGGDLLSNVVDLSQAKASYQANAAVLKTSNDLTREAINLIS